jgi:hypothetical protein
MHVYRPECGGWTRCVLSHQPCGLMVDGWLACAALLISTHAPIRGDSRGICEDIIRPSLSGCAYYAVRTQGLWGGKRLDAAQVSPHVVLWLGGQTYQ